MNRLPITGEAELGKSLLASSVQDVVIAISRAPRQSRLVVMIPSPDPSVYYISAPAII
jgi:hypothetical protein